MGPEGGGGAAPGPPGGEARGGARGAEGTLGEAGVRAGGGLWQLGCWGER